MNRQVSKLRANLSLKTNLNPERGLNNVREATPQVKAFLQETLQAPRLHSETPTWSEYNNIVLRVKRFVGFGFNIEIDKDAGFQW